MTSARTVTVAVLVVTAGCLGVTSDDADEPGTVPSQLRGTPNLTERPTPELSARLPSGVTTEAVDAYTVGLLHRTKLRSVNRTLVSTIQYRTPDGVVVGAARKRVRTVEQGWTLRALVTVTTTGRAPASVGLSRANATHWGNRSVSVSRFVRNGSVRYAVRDSQLPLVIRQAISGVGAVSYVFTRVEVTGVASVGRTDGIERFRVEATAANASALGAWNLSLVAVVDAAGIVRSYRFAYTTERANRTLRVVRTFRVVSLGNATAPRPPWFDTARRNGSVSDRVTERSLVERYHDARRVVHPTHDWNAMEVGRVTTGRSPGTSLTTASSVVAGVARRSPGGRSATSPSR
ncbi:MAG: hypothetical protein ABEI75_02015 [Halobaculum sp.]